MLDGDGNVLARPLHKFFSEKQYDGIYVDHECIWGDGDKVREATPKLDGSMVYAVPVGQGIGLWTRSGRPEHAVAATWWAAAGGCILRRHGLLGTYR